MYDLLKEVADRCVQANLNFGFKVATVKNSKELVLDQGLILPIEPCLITEDLCGLKIVINNQEFILKQPIETGDKLLLLNIGDTYCILDRLGNSLDPKIVEINI